MPLIKGTVKWEAWREKVRQNSINRMKLFPEQFYKFLQCAAKNAQERRGVPLSLEHRAKVGYPKGRPASTERKAKVSAALTGHSRYQNKEWRSKISSALKGRSPSVNTINALKAYHASLSPEQKSEAARRRVIARWKTRTPEQIKEELKKPQQASQKANPSSLERIVSAILDGLKIDYSAQQFIGPFMVDFYIPSLKLVIECDGTYWHGLPGRKEEDRTRDAKLASWGYKVLRLSEKEIKSGHAERILLKVV